jgi:hypothetical protein
MIGMRRPSLQGAIAIANLGVFTCLWAILSHFFPGKGGEACLAQSAIESAWSILMLPVALPLLLLAEGCLPSLPARNVAFILAIVLNAYVWGYLGARGLALFRKQRNSPTDGNAGPEHGARD